MRMLTLTEFPAVCDAVRVAAGYAVVGEPLHARLRSLYLCVGCVFHPGMYVYIFTCRMYVYIFTCILRAPHIQGTIYYGH
jgi:hypothetical protein